MPTQQNATFMHCSPCRPHVLRARAHSFSVRKRERAYRCVVSLAYIRFLFLSMSNSNFRSFVPKFSLWLNVRTQPLFAFSLTVDAINFDIVANISTDSVGNDYDLTATQYYWLQMKAHTHTHARINAHTMAPSPNTMHRITEHISNDSGFQFTIRSLSLCLLKYVYVRLVFLPHSMVALLCRLHHKGMVCNRYVYPLNTSKIFLGRFGISKRMNGYEWRISFMPVG